MRRQLVPRRVSKEVEPEASSAKSGMRVKRLAMVGRNAASQRDLTAGELSAAKKRVQKARCGGRGEAQLGKGHVALESSW